MSQRMFFREQALQHYNNQDQPASLPRFVSLRFAACLWIVLTLCVGAAAATWVVQVPVYLPVNGIVQASQHAG